MLVSHVEGDETTTASPGADQPQISADGNVVVFASQPADVVSGDDNGLGDVFALALTASNTAPTASIATVGAVRVEGTSIAVSGSGTDAEQAAGTLSYSWAVYKDGSATPFATGTRTDWSFTPDDDGSYRIVLTVTDDGGLSDDEQTISVANVAPTPSIVSIGAVRIEGTSIAASGSASDPAGANDTLSYSWEVYKDGGVTPFATGSGSDFSFTPDDDSYRIVLTVSDEDGGSASAEQTIAVSNAAPVPSIVSVGDVRVEGTSIAVSGSATDAAGANDTLSYSWQVYKDGGATPFATGSGTDWAFTPDDDGSYRIVLTVSDEDGGSASAEQPIAVGNVVPTLVLSGNTGVNEGSPYTLQLSASDPGADTISGWVVNWGDGQIETVAGNSSSLTHTYADDGIFTIFASALDEDGSYAATLTVSIGNLPPTAITLLSATVPENATGAVVGSVSVSDPGSHDTFTFSVSDPRFVVTADGVLKLADGVSLNYETQSGIPLTVTATDDSWASLTLPFDIAVTDQDESVVTGATGLVFLDLDGDGIRDSGERGLAGRIVFVDLNRNEQFDPNEPFAVTDSLGQYRLMGVKSGTHVIRQLLMPGEVSITPEGATRTVSLRDEQLLGELDFGTRLHSTVSVAQTGGNLFQPTGNPQEDLVSSLYRGILDREGNDAEVAMWRQHLTDGLSREQAVWLIWNSREHRLAQVQGFYSTYLGRAGGTEEVASWATHLMNGMTEEQVALAFVTSAEYVALHPSPDDCVGSLYRNVLGREASQEEIMSNRERLAAGVTREQVAVGVIGSPEARLRAINSFYVSLLNRETAPSERDAWLSVALLRQNCTDVALAILASDEFVLSAS